MRINRQRRDWEDLSALDPYWAVLSDPSRRFGGWSRDELLASGVSVVDAILRKGSEFERPKGHRSALDFGCGVGRLTRVLAQHFDRCLGLDISNRMIAEAREAAADLENCVFEINDGPDLAGLQTHSFDIVMSCIVLQHIPAAESKRRYIEEFVRVLRPCGLLAFQLPSWIPFRHRVQPRPRLYGLLRGMGVPPETLYRRLRLNPMRMTFLSQQQVIATIKGAGGRPLNVSQHASPGGVVSAEYLVTKDRQPGECDRSSS
jgi:SAM-dependent methyltransferase